MVFRYFFRYKGTYVVGIPLQFYRKLNKIQTYSCKQYICSGGSVVLEGSYQNVGCPLLKKI